MKLVSIIIPTFNSSKFASQLCESVLGQTYSNLEIIVVDNFSSDDTLNEIKKYNNNDKRFKFFQLDNKGVIAKSRNYGIKYSSGEYLAFHDSDDFWFKNKLSEVMTYFPNYDFVYHNLKINRQNRLNLFQKKFNSYQLSKNPFLDLMTKGNPISTSSVVCKKELFKDTIFPEDRKLIAVEDYDCWINLSRKNIRFKEIKNCLGFYNIVSTNISLKIKNNYQIFYIFLKYKNFLKNIKDISCSKNLFRYIAANQTKKIKYKKKVFFYLLKSNYIKISKIKILIKLLIKIFN